MSKQYSRLLDTLLDGQSLAEAQAYDLMHRLAEGELPSALAGALLAGLRAKGETSTLWHSKLKVYQITFRHYCVGSRLRSSHSRLYSS